MRKKAIALVVCFSMALSFLIGCGSQNAENKSSESKESQAVEKTAASESEKASAEEEEKELVSLRLVMYGELTTRREEFLKNEFHDAVLEDLNIDLSVEFLPWGSDSVVRTMLTSGEAFALNYRYDRDDYFQKGYLAEIPMELIEEKCPTYLQMRGSKGFKAASYDGKILCMPFGNKASGGRHQFYTVRKDMLDELGYKAEEITTLDKWIEVCEAVHQTWPDVRVIPASTVDYSMLGYVFTGEVPTMINSYGYINELEEGSTVYNYYESELFKKVAEYHAEMIESGYIIPDMFTDPGKANADWKAGLSFSKAGVPGEIVETGFISTIPGAEITRVKIGDAPFVTTMDYDWGISISAADEEHVDRWLELIEWMYKDQETYDFLIYGVEGKDYERNEDGSINKLVTDVFWEDWFMMADCYQTYSSMVTEENIQIYLDTDKDVIESKTMGFVFDSSAVSTEISMIQAAYDEYMKPIEMGIDAYDSHYEEALKKMKDAGLDTVVEEIQNQFSAWYANNR